MLNFMISVIFKIIQFLIVGTSLILSGVSFIGIIFSGTGRVSLFTTISGQYLPISFLLIFLCSLYFKKYEIGGYALSTLSFIHILFFANYYGFSFFGGNGLATKVFPKNKIAQEMAEAATQGDISKLKKLKESGGDVKVIGEKLMTLTHFALYAKTPEALVWLVKQGADPISALANGDTVPHLAIAKKNEQGKPTADWIRPLLELGVSPDLVGDEGGHTLLVTSAIFDNLDAAKALKAAGANMNLMPSPLDGTAIHWALTRRNLDLAAELADLGVDPKISQRTGPKSFNAAEQYCEFLSGRLIGPERKASYQKMVKAFEKWNLKMPCDF